MSRYLRIVWVIAKNVYREAIRDRLLYGILIVALLVTGASFFLATISFEQNSRILQNVGLASIHIFALFITVFVATNSVTKDFERRTLYLLFPKPISRSQYILGKYVGMLLLLVTTLAVLGGLFSVGAFLTDRGILLGTLMNIGYSFLEISLLTAFAILFATFTAPLNAALYTIALFIIGHSLSTMRDFVSRLENAAVLQKMISACYYVLPNLDKFDKRQAILYGLHIGASQVLWSIIYWAIYTGIILYLAVLVMRKQEV
jgi:Cu-processing system permease protein